MLTNRQKEINDFLVYYANIYANNPNFPITSDTIYHGLMSYDVGQDFRRQFDDALFPRWERRYQNSNLRVFVSERQKGFLQFWSKNHQTDEHREYKLYVNLPTDCMEEGVNRIFDFIDNNNIQTFSKVSRNTRADEIVLRINKEEDMLKVVSFINEDRLLRKKSKRTNPFLARFGNVGAAYDAMESYNSTVSDLIANYFEMHRNTNTLNLVSIEDFKQYIDKIRSQVFTNHQSMVDYFNRSNFRDYSRHNSKQGQIYNYKQIFEMLSANLESDLKLENYVEIVRRFQNPNIEKNEQQIIERIYTTKGYNQEDQEQIPTEDLTEQLNPNYQAPYDESRQILDSYISLAIQKYGIEKTPKYLNRYMNGYLDGITRDYNFRHIFRTKMSPDKILEITNFNIETYVANYYKMAYHDKYMLFVEACTATMLKYGESQLRTAIANALDGEFKYLTNFGINQYRRRLMDTCNKADILNVVQSVLLAEGKVINEETLVHDFSNIIQREVYKRQGTVTIK